MNFQLDENWTILSPIEQSIKQKIESAGTPLKDWDIKINRGILTGLNEAFIIDRIKRDELVEKDPKSAEIIRPILRGKDIKRNSYSFNDKYVILAYFNSHSIIPTEYPAVYSWLKQFKEKLERRGQCKYTSSGKPNPNAEYPGQHHWLELDNNPRREYMDDFNKQKIIYSEIVRSPQFLLDEEGFIPEATAFIMSGEHLNYLVQYLNSNIAAWIFKTYYAGGGLGESGYRYKKTFLINLPVPRRFDIKVLDDGKIAELYGLTDAEINFISSSVSDNL